MFEDFRILVLGDVHLDSLLLPLPKANAASLSNPQQPFHRAEEMWQLVWRRGGAWFAHEMVSAAVSFGPFGKPIVDTYDQQGITDHDLRSGVNLPYPRSLVALKEFASHSGSAQRVCRIEKFVGWVEDYDGNAHRDTLKNHLMAVRNEPCPRIVVLHDRGRAFRQLTSDLPDTFWDAIESSWIVWQMDSPLAEGALWDHFVTKRRLHGRTVVVLSADSVRQAGADLPHDISLEREAINFVRSLDRVDCLRKLREHTRHIVVHFPRVGILHYDCMPGVGMKKSCYYCPELESIADDKQGTLKGYRSLAVAAIVRGIAWELRDKPPTTSNDVHVAEGVVSGVMQAVVADHLFYELGYVGAGSPQREQELRQGSVFKEIFNKLQRMRYNEEEGKKYQLAALELPPLNYLNTWNRIDGFVRQTSGLRAYVQSPIDASLTIGSQIVCVGLHAVIYKKDDRTPPADGSPFVPPVTIKCPYEKHGDLITADSEEIERLAAVRRIISKYLKTDSWTKPLCIAVFGPPGSGKNFALSQVVTSVTNDENLKSLEYNVAQFANLEDLEIAFHQVQDRAIGKEVPLVVFDEFDCRLGADELGWLKYFLAPMQDGKFKAGESSYRIGRAIFAFCGGVSGKFETFCESIAKKAASNEGEDRVKGSDFVSRLRCHLDILGINETIGPRLVFRRAVLLRSLLENFMEKVIDENKRAQVDSGVIDAFLQVSKYHHEARSMQAIVQMSEPSPHGEFLVSSLPASAQLNMHVDAEEFYRLATARMTS